MEMYLIYDRKAETLMSFFTAKNSVDAIRSTVASAKNPGTTLSEYPAEFELRRVGNIDPKTCRITIYEIPEMIGSVETLLNAAMPKKND